MRTPAASARAAMSGAFRLSSSQPSRILSVTGTSTASTTASTSDSARSGSRIRAEPERPPTTFLAGQPMLMSMTCAPCPSSIRAARAIQTGSRPASWTEVRARPSPSSAFSSVPGRPCTISWLAIISLTTRPAPKRETRSRNGRSVIPAMGASRTGGVSAIAEGAAVTCLILVQ